jgi:pimeloyl-ACP methyl ester carboxylesterase
MTPSGWITRDGLRLAVYSGGTEGPPLVFQHGLCGDVGQVAEAMAGLGNQRWQCLECRGHGQSAFGPVSIATYADDVAAMIEGMGEPVILGGVSMGAAIATRLAVTRPELVRALVLVRPAWVVDAAPANMEPVAEMGALLAEMSGPEASAAFIEGGTAEWLLSVAEDNVHSLIGFTAREPQGQTATLLTTIAADGPGITDGDLLNLRLPTLIFGSRKDEIHPKAHAELLEELIKTSVMLMLPPKLDDRAAHFEVMARFMTQFIKEVSDAPPAR